MNFSNYTLQEAAAKGVEIDKLSTKFAPSKRDIQITAVHGSFRDDAANAPQVHAGSWAQMLDRVVQLAFDKYQQRKLDPTKPINVYIFQYTFSSSSAYPEIMIEDPEYDHNLTETQNTDAAVILYLNALEGDKTLSVLIRDKNAVIATPPAVYSLFDAKFSALVQSKASSSKTKQMYKSMYSAYMSFTNTK